MGIDIRFPSISGTTEKERLRQMESFLFQMVEQLNWALQNVDTANAAVVTPTARSLAPAVSGGSDSPSDPLSTFNSIKALIIKSAEIVEAYSEEVKERLEGHYVAQSEFGTYKVQTANEITSNSNATTQNFENLQTLTEKVDGANALIADTKEQLQGSIDGIGAYDPELKQTVIGVSACIKVGLLSDEGSPIYGIEVGQTDTVNGGEVFNKYARFTAGRLSFYDKNDTEVAYISDYKLHITHAEVTGTLKIGGYLVKTTNGLTFKWVGRS